MLHLLSSVKKSKASQLSFLLTFDVTKMVRYDPVCILVGYISVIRMAIALLNNQSPFRQCFDIKLKVIIVCKELGIAFFEKY